jgi:hypothetical protein
MLAAALIASTFTVAAPPPDDARNDLDVDALLDRVDDVWRGDASHARLSMKVKTEHYERTMEMEA